MAHAGFEHHNSGVRQRGSVAAHTGERDGVHERHGLGVYGAIM